MSPTRTAVLLALAAGLAGAVPAVGAEKAYNTFQRIDRAPLPGERAAAMAQGGPALLSDQRALAMAATPRELDVYGGSDGSSGVRFSVTGQGTIGNPNARDRASRYLGDGVGYYDNDSFQPSIANSYYGWGYGGTPRLAYNESYLRYRYGGNIAGLPSVGAPLDFWRK